MAATKKTLLQEQAANRQIMDRQREEIASLKREASERRPAAGLCVADSAAIPAKIDAVFKDLQERGRATIERLTEESHREMMSLRAELARSESRAAASRAMLDDSRK